MNKRIPLIAIALAIFFFSCRPVYFNTPNDLRNIRGTVFLTNGKSVDGKIIINKSNFLSSPVKVYTEGDKKPMQFPLMDVKGYQIRGDYYALKEIKGGISIGNRYSFMKRLTNESSRIQLFENVEKHTSSSGYNNTISTTTYETEYFMQLPSEEGDAVWSLSSNKFVPNFDEKMSRMVSDCPALAQKIADKEEGYFYRQVTMFKEKRADVLLNIISEYNNCQ